MEKATTRIKRIEIENIKNVKHGIIDIKPNTNEINESNIVGIYGQNGSGKSSLIDAMLILKNYLMGLDFENVGREGINKNYLEYISYGEEYAKLHFDFLIERFDENYEIELEFKIKDEKNKVVVFDEVIKYKDLNIEGFVREKLIDTCNLSLNKHFKSSANIAKKFKINKNQEFDLIVSRRMAIEKSESFIFRNDTLDILDKISSNTVFLNLINALHYFGTYNLHVIENIHHALINSNLYFPLSYVLNDSVGELGLVFGSNVMPEEAYNKFINVIEQLKILIESIIPGMTLDTKIIDTTLSENNEKEFNVQLLSVRNGKELPIRYESDGIKKIISILSSLIAMYNKDNVILAIDELDSGIFEYLLGEILEVVRETGRGQLFFTSHNLRPLEVLDKKEIYFTTTNESNRYIKFKGIKPNNNLRDVYLRAITLGGQKEEVYEQTDAYKIRRAFKLAGRCLKCDQQEE